MRAEQSVAFVFRRSDRPNGAWAIYAPSTTDEDIASGKAEPLLTGTAAFDAGAEMWTRPNGKDYRTAKGIHYEREGRHDYGDAREDRPAPPVCKMCEREMPREKLDAHGVCLGCRIASDPAVAIYHYERARRHPDLYAEGFVVADCRE